MATCPGPPPPPPPPTFHALYSPSGERQVPFVGQQRARGKTVPKNINWMFIRDAVSEALLRAQTDEMCGTGRAVRG